MLLIIIFVKLISRVSVSMAVLMNYIQMTLINQQNELLCKCCTRMDLVENALAHTHPSGLPHCDHKFRGCVAFPLMM